MLQVYVLEIDEILLMVFSTSVARTGKAVLVAASEFFLLVIIYR